MASNSVKYHVIGGGTFSPVRNHLAIAAPAFGTTARKIAELLRGQKVPVTLHLTKMADSESGLITNNDVASLVDELLADPATKAIIMNAALCDFDGEIDGVRSGWHAERLQSREGARSIDIKPAAKILDRIHKTRSDVSVVGFKTTTGMSPAKQFELAQRQIALSHVSFVLANDTVLRTNMVVRNDAEKIEDALIITQDRSASLQALVKAVVSRVQTLNP